MNNKDQNHIVIVEAYEGFIEYLSDNCSFHICCRNRHAIKKSNDEVLLTLI
jgi:hypothetical protein